jgi:hypothetical protein
VFMVKVIVESIANVISNAVNNAEYLRLTFIAGTILFRDRAIVLNLVVHIRVITKGSPALQVWC